MLSKLVVALTLLSCTLHSSQPISARDMSLEEKIGQLLMVHFNGEQVNDDATKLIKEAHAGAIIYYRWSNGLHNPKQVAELSLGLQNVAAQTRLHISLLIAVDQEGGRVTRLKEGFTQCPSNQVIAATGDPAVAEHYAFTVGQELRSVGINLNLAPVVDVNSNPRNPLIGDRSYGQLTDTVIAFGKMAIEGYHRAHVFISLKHFPGHGDVEVDSHVDLPVVKKSRAELDRIELLPFSALAPYADTIMTAHILVPSLDPIHCATTSKPIIDILRKEIGFNGPVITDSLVMQGILNECKSPEEACIAALDAGCDILLLGGKQLVGTETRMELSTADIIKIHQHLVNAVKSGRISERRIDESVDRILALKQKLTQ